MTMLTPEQMTYIPMFTGSNFASETATKPIEGANGNVAFPAHWGHWQCALWRYRNDCPGCGWSYEDGFKTVGVPTPGGLAMAAFLNWWFRQKTAAEAY